MKRPTFAVVAALMVGIGVSGAVLAQPGPGKKQADVPPQLVMKDGFRVWNNPSAFGPVPSELMETGRNVCAAMNTGKDVYVPTGYHARAKDPDGNEFQGGGYYCVRK
jgi:hypothetical protein